MAATHYVADGGLSNTKAISQVTLFHISPKMAERDDHPLSWRKSAWSCPVKALPSSRVPDPMCNPFELSFQISFKSAFQRAFRKCTQTSHSLANSCTLQRSSGFHSEWEAVLALQAPSFPFQVGNFGSHGLYAFLTKRLIVHKCCFLTISSWRNRLRGHDERTFHYFYYPIQ